MAIEWAASGKSGLSPGMSARPPRKPMSKQHRLEELQAEESYYLERSYPDEPYPDEQLPAESPKGER